MNTVSFETAKRLKEAGFPQPFYPDFGDVYADNFGKLFVVAGKFAGSEYYCQQEGGQHLTCDISKFTYCPCITKILKELGPEFDIGVTVLGPLWTVSRRNDNNDITESFLDDNPAEAAALAWLKLNEK